MMPRSRARTQWLLIILLIIISMAAAHEIAHICCRFIAFDIKSIIIFKIILFIILVVPFLLATTLIRKIPEDNRIRTI